MQRHFSTACTTVPVTSPVEVFDGQPAYSSILHADNSTTTCPNTGDGSPGWTRIDNKTAGASDAAGSFSHDNSDQLTYLVNVGYALQLGVKSYQDVIYYGDRRWSVQ